MDIRSIINPCESSKADAIKDIKNWFKEQQNAKKHSNSDSICMEYVSQDRIMCDWGCSLSFTKRYYLEQHKRTALIHEEDRLKAGYPELRYVCPLCDCYTAFNIYSNLVKHLKQIHAVTDYKNLIGTKSKPMTSQLITQYR